MPLSRVRRATAGLIACVVAVACASPAAADPMDPIPGNGVFHVGTDIAPGIYRTNGPSTPLIIILSDLSSIPTCSWSTYGKPAAGPDDVIDTNSSLGPMYAMLSARVAAFKTTNCQPWTRVNQPVWVP